MMSDEWKPSLSKPNVVCDKSYTFALKIVSLARTLRKQGEYELASQVLRSGTSIGANIEEAQSGVSRADFAAKIGIASKEARETHYWLRLIRDAQLIQQDNIAPRIQEVSELLRLLTAIVKSVQVHRPSTLNIHH
jgi:four helix bundle protein